MKTVSYNPSSLEVDFAKALHIVREDIGKHLTNNHITHVENYRGKDKPTIKFRLVDGDGDPHEIVGRIIEVPDKF